MTAAVVLALFCGISIINIGGRQVQWLDITKHTTRDIYTYRHKYIEHITVFAAILTSKQRLRRRGYQFPDILCKKMMNEANPSDISWNFCIISDSCQSKT